MDDKIETLLEFPIHTLYFKDFIPTVIIPKLTEIIKNRY